MELSKKSLKFDLCDSYEIYKEKVIGFFGENASQLRTVKFVKVNCFEYREGFMIIVNRTVYEIILIINENSTISFLCHPYFVKKYDNFFHSIEIEKLFSDNSGFEIFKLDCLHNPQPYERKLVDEKIFIFCNGLEFKHFDT